MRPDTNGFMVDLGGALPLYVLPEPHTGNQLKDDVQATLRLRDLGWTDRPTPVALRPPLSPYRGGRYLGHVTSRSS